MPAVSLTQTLTQKTQLSLQMRQSVELLQLSGPELQNEIDARLLANPLLKADDEGGFAFESASAAEEAPAPQKSREPVRDAGVARDFREPNYLTWRGTLSDKEDFDPYGTLSSEESLCEHLLGQLGCLHLSADERQRCEWIIGNLDERGFLPEPLEDIARGFEQEAGRSSDMTAWRTALRLVRSFDPAGVAASGPTEALLLQLDRTQCEKSVRKAAEELLRQMPEALAKRDYKGAAKALGCPPEVIEQAHALVLSLNPQPASLFSDTREAGCVIAEVLLVKEANRWKAVLNPAVVTHLRFDEETFSLLTQAKLQGKDLAEWRERARDAKGFVRSLEMRYSTVTAVAQTIADLQADFFTLGPKALKPMGLRDVAQRLNLAESTVSRAAAGKYLQSPSGTFELRYFFTAALAGEDGEAASAAAARRLIVEAVAAEDPAKPLSDAAIVEILAGKGVHLARRTVAKYREIEKIPPKSLRKKAV